MPGMNSSGIELIMLTIQGRLSVQVYQGKYFFYAWDMIVFWFRSVRLKDSFFYEVRFQLLRGRYSSVKNLVVPLLPKFSGCYDGFALS